MSDINSVKAAILTKLASLLPYFDTADGFCNRELYSPLLKPLVVVSLKNAALQSVFLGRPIGEYTKPTPAKRADILFALNIYCPSAAQPNDISCKLASCLLSDITLDVSDFSCKKISYNNSFKLYEQECEAHISCILGG